jgi:hypothetical protein
VVCDGASQGVKEKRAGGTEPIDGVLVNFHATAKQVINVVVKFVEDVGIIRWEVKEQFPGRVG